MRLVGSGISTVRNTYQTYRFVQTTFAEGSSLRFSFGTRVFKYVPEGGKLYPFNPQGLSFTTTSTFSSTPAAYSRLGLGFMRGAQVNTMPASFTQHQLTLRGFYLTGNVGRQGLTLGGAQQSVGFKGLTFFGRSPSMVGRTPQCLACTEHYNRFISMMAGH